jgi:hypothetical protein
MKNLERLHIGFNPLREVPPEIGELEHLQFLFLKCTLIEVFPMETFKHVKQIQCHGCSLLLVKRDIVALGEERTKRIALTAGLPLKIAILLIFQDESLEKQMLQELTVYSPPSLVDSCARFLVNKTESIRLEMLPVELRQSIVATLDESISQRCSNCGKLYFQFFIELFRKISTHVVAEVNNVTVVHKLCSFVCLKQVKNKVYL